VKNIMKVIQGHVKVGKLMWSRVVTDMGDTGASISPETSVEDMLEVISTLDAKSELKGRVWDESVLQW